MAKPQLEDGHTQIANEILEHLMKLHLAPNQWQVLLCIIRKTYGFHKKVDYIANSQIVEATGLCKAVVSRALHCLEDMMVITRNSKEIGFQKDWEQWKKLAVSSTKVSSIVNNKELEKLAISSTPTPEVSNSANNEKLAILSSKVSNSAELLAISSTKVSSCAVAQKIKDTITKDTKQKKGLVVLPKWIDKETWDAFLEMRKEKKAIPTTHAKELLIKELDKLKLAGDDPNEVLNRSIINGWKGVFPLSKKQATAPKDLGQGEGGQHGTGYRPPKPDGASKPGRTIDAEGEVGATS
jgi:phage replication O-like protein O